MKSSQFLFALNKNVNFRVYMYSLYGNIYQQFDKMVGTRKISRMLVISKTPRIPTFEELIIACIVSLIAIIVIALVKILPFHFGHISVLFVHFIEFGTVD